MYGTGDEAFKNMMKNVSHHYVNEDSFEKMLQNGLLNYMFTHYFPNSEMTPRYNTDVNEYMTWFINKESISDAGQVDSNSDLPPIVLKDNGRGSKNYSNKLPPIRHKS